MKMAEMPSLPPAFAPSPSAPTELSLARDALETALVLDAALGDDAAFDRDAAQLAPYYADARGVPTFYYAFQMEKMFTECAAPSRRAASPPGRHAPARCPTPDARRPPPTARAPPQRNASRGRGCGEARRPPSLPVPCAIPRAPPPI